MRFRLLILILIVSAVCIAQAPPASHKPLTKEEILELTRNYVPSQRLADLVQQYGIDFTLGDDFLKAIREAGGEDVLISALRAAKSVLPRGWRRHAFECLRLRCLNLGKTQTPTDTESAPAPDFRKIGNIAVTDFPVRGFPGQLVEIIAVPRLFQRRAV